MKVQYVYLDTVNPGPSNKREKLGLKYNWQLFK